jgi:hypothetical protein
MKFGLWMLDRISIQISVGVRLLEGILATWGIEGVLGFSLPALDFGSSLFE